VPVHGQVRDPVTGEHRLDGSVLLHQDESGLQVVQGPRCDCGHDLAGPADSCGHSELAAAELVDRLGSPQARTPERQAAGAVLLITDHRAGRAAGLHVRTACCTICDRLTAESIQRAS
jgi:hypothetical protein